MNLTSLPPHSLLASVLAAVLSLSFVHGDTLVADNFNSLGNQSPLHGRTPSTTTSGIQNWIANSGFSGDVSGGLGNFVYGGTGTVEIPPLVTGNVYEYNLDVLVNDIGTAQWLGLGFMDLSPLSSSSTIANVSSTRAAMFLRGNGEVQVYSSAGNVITSTGAGFVTPGQSHTLRLVVDTTVDGAWTFAAYAGGTQLDLNPGDGGSMHYTYSGNQSLSRVAISASSSVPAGSYVDNMSLEMNPEAGGGGDYKSVLNVYNNWRVWGYNWQSGDPLITSLSNTFNTTENGGTSTTFAFSDPVAGVDVQDPNHPDFQTASDSNFGYSSTHSTLGVGHATTGRFTRGDSFILTVGRKFQFQKLAWRAISANADLHLAWTQDGNPQTLVLPVEDLMDLSSYNVVADAGTDIVFTNVADVNEYTNDTIVGFKYFTGWLMFDTEPAYDFSGADGLPQMFGVNIAGAEFDGHSFLEALDDPEQWAYYESKGIELIRFPFRWKRIQPTLGGPLDATQLANLQAAADLCEQYNMRLILDVHDYFSWGGADGFSVRIGETNNGYTVTEAHFRDLWRRLALEFKDHPAVYGYGLMNEPFGTSDAEWASAAQQAVYGIRNDAGDLNQWIVLTGHGWGKAKGWPEDRPNVIAVDDPADKIMYEAHIYFNRNDSGVDYGSYDGESASPERFLVRGAEFINWLQATGNRGFIGEFNVPSDGDPRWMEGLALFVDTLMVNGLSATYWAGGSRWSPSNLLIHPDNNYYTDKPQMSVLEQYRLLTDIPSEIIVDNSDYFGVSLTGTWATSSGIEGYYAANYLHDNQRGKGLKSVTFTPNLPVSGTYEVSMYWSADEHRAHNVPVDVYYDGGIDLVQVNQQFDGGQWNVLGAYEFTAGTSGHVVIGNDNTTGFVIADAVRFVNVTEGSSPPAGGESVSLGAVNRGVAARDHATGDGFILWSEQNVYDRFDPDPYWDNSSNLIAVVWDGSQWLVDNNDVLTPFSPTATDVLIAEVDFTNDTITSLEGVDSTYQGIADGYASGDLTFSADIWNGNPNDGEFTVEGTGFVKN